VLIVGIVVRMNLFTILYEIVSYNVGLFLVLHCHCQVRSATVVVATSTPVPDPLVTQTKSARDVAATTATSTVSLVTPTRPACVATICSTVAVVSTPVTVSAPVTPAMPARVTTADIMTILVRLEQKVDVMMNDVTRLSADSVAIRHELVVCNCILFLY